MDTDTIWPRIDAMLRQANVQIGHGYFRDGARQRRIYRLHQQVLRRLGRETWVTYRHPR